MTVKTDRASVEALAQNHHDCSAEAAAMLRALFAERDAALLRIAEYIEYCSMLRSECTKRDYRIAELEAEVARLRRAESLCPHGYPQTVRCSRCGE